MSATTIHHEGSLEELLRVVARQAAESAEPLFPATREESYRILGVRP